MHRDIYRGGRVFLAGLGFGALFAVSASALGAYRSFPVDSHCQKLDGTADTFRCGITTGTDFPAATLGTVEIDFYYGGLTADTIRYGACRYSWNSVTSACSPEASIPVSNQAQTIAGAVVAANGAVRGGSQYDYRYVFIGANKASTYLDVKGLYISNTAGN